mmetsp:Transcript_77303/g.177078  ORF Transcript_77303/g.177078 Transcript_77303/m.177078 type:complete len:241 (+) Transcript_77303:96-818(+)
MNRDQVQPSSSTDEWKLLIAERESLAEQLAQAEQASDRAKAGAWEAKSRLAEAQATLRRLDEELQDALAALRYLDREDEKAAAAEELEYSSLCKRSAALDRELEELAQASSTAAAARVAALKKALRHATRAQKAADEAARGPLVRPQGVSNAAWRQREATWKAAVQAGEGVGREVQRLREVLRRSEWHRKLGGMDAVMQSAEDGATWSPEKLLKLLRASQSGLATAGAARRGRSTPVQLR